MAGEQCALKLCKEVEQCSSVKEGQPSGVFLAFSGYYFTHSFFKLGSSFSLKNLEKKGKAYCDIEWKTLTRVAEYGNVKEKYLKRYCFNTAYITNLLQSGYGFPADTQQIIIADSLHSHKISWTLGAMLGKLAGS